MAAESLPVSVKLAEPDAPELVVPAAVEKEWDESRHPRVPAGSSEGGEFTSGELARVESTEVGREESESGLGTSSINPAPLPESIVSQEGVTVYHGTSDSLRRRIESEGFRTGFGGKEKGRVPSVYVAMNLRYAAMYARAAAEKLGGKPVVFKITISEKEFREKFKYDELSHHYGGFRIQGSISPHAITRVVRVRATAERKITLSKRGESVVDVYAAAVVVSN